MLTRQGSLHLLTFSGIAVFVHWTWFAAAFFLFTLTGGRDFFGFLAIYCSLFGIVLLHEFGHCFACRRVGGVADRIVLLPWGGLALCMPPREWKADFITTAGGPLVNVALVPVTVGIMLALGLGDALLFNVFDPWGVLSSGWFNSSSTAMYWVKVGAFWFYFINLVLLAFNVLVPCYPLDGGRLVQALLWRKRGFKQSMEIATLIGFFGAGVMLILGLAMNQVFLVVIAAFCGLSCFTERQRVRSEFEIVGDASPSVFRPKGKGDSPWAASLRDDGPAPERGPSKRELRAQKKAEEDERTLDELLDKIRDHGMHALSKKERATLDRLSRARRDG